MGAPCIHHEGAASDELAGFYLTKDVFDQLQLKPDKAALSWAVYIGAIVLAVALTE